MYAIVKTGGKQYKVALGEKLNIEKLPAEVGDKVELPVICVVDGKKVEADPSKAAGTKVEAVVIEQFKDKKVVVFKFKKRKNYRRKRGHRQNLTRVQIMQIGSEKYTEPAKKAAPKKAADKAEAPSEKAAEKKSTATAEKKPAAKKTSTAAEKKPAAKKTAASDAEKKPAAKKTTTAAKKTTTAAKKTTTAKEAEDKAAE